MTSLNLLIWDRLQGEHVSFYTYKFTIQKLWLLVF